MKKFLMLIALAAFAMTATLGCGGDKPAETQKPVIPPDPSHTKDLPANMKGIPTKDKGK